MMRFPGATARATAIVLALALPALAAGPRVLVLSVGLDSPTRAVQGSWELAAEESLLRAGRFEVLPATEAFEGSAGKIRQQKLSDAQARVKDGQKALDDLDNNKATEAFVAALALFKETDFSKTFPSFVDAWVLKAASHATGGESAAAKSDIEKIVVLRPATEFPTAFFPPELIKYAEAQKKLSARGDLVISTEPEGARVFVDGLFKGISPVTAKGLPAGRHFVTASLTGYYLVQKEVALGSEAITLLPSDNAALLSKGVDAVARDPEGPGRDGAVRALGAKLGVAQVVAIVARKSTAGERAEVTVQRVDVRDGHNLGFAQSTLSLDDADALGRLVDGVLTSDAPRDGSNPVTHFKSGSTLSGRKLAGYSLLGAGVALVGVGIASGLQAQGAADEFHRTPQVQELKSANLASRGRAFSVVADVSYLLGAAAVASGAVLAFTGGNQVSTEEDSSSRNAARSSPPPARKSEPAPAAAPAPASGSSGAAAASGSSTSGSSAGTKSSGPASGNSGAGTASGSSSGGSSTGAKSSGSTSSAGTTGGSSTGGSSKSGGTAAGSSGATTNSGSSTGTAGSPKGGATAETKPAPSEAPTANDSKAEEDRKKREEAEAARKAEEKRKADEEKKKADKDKGHEDDLRNY